MGYVKWLGHAAFEVLIDGKLVYVDPWLTNPLSPIGSPRDVRRADVVLVTHDHGDHLGEAVDIARATGATFVSIYELAVYASEQGVRDVVGMNIGGTAEVKGLKVVMTPALHSSTRGSPVGFVVIGKEFSFYHAGDTGLFGDMKLIGELYRPKIAMLPIGSLYTMGPREAAKAVELIRPEVVIPMHYNTFDAIRQDPEEFKRLVDELGLGVKVVVLKPGESIEVP